MSSQRERIHERLMADDLQRAEDEVSDLRLQNESLELLVASLMNEMQGQESRRQQERLRRQKSEATAAVPRAAMDAAKDAFVDGSAALVAAHEHA